MQIHRRPCQHQRVDSQDSQIQTNKYLISIYPRKQVQSIFRNSRLLMTMTDKRDMIDRHEYKTFKKKPKNPIITWNQPPTTAYSTETTTYFTKTSKSTAHIAQFPHSNIPMRNFIPKLKCLKYFSVTHSFEYQPRPHQIRNKIKWGEKRHYVQENTSEQSTNRLKT